LKESKDSPNYARWAVTGVIAPIVVIMILRFAIAPSVWGPALANQLGQALGFFYVLWLLVLAIAATLLKIWRERAHDANRPFTHPELGELVYDGSAWRTPVDKEWFVSICGTQQGPDDRLVKLASSVKNSLGEFEEAARQFAGASAHGNAPLLEKLIGAEFLFPDKDWLKREQSLAPGLTVNDPIFALTFALRGDRNVLDVMFVFGKPIEIDYH